MADRRPRGRLPSPWPLVGRREHLDAFLASLSGGSCRGFVIGGPPGAGKTRLAQECVAAAAARDHPVARVTATATARAVPLGALAHLLPPGSYVDGDPVAVFGAAAAALSSPDGAIRVLLVDDLPLLDPTSSTVLGQLLDAGVVFLVGTVRSGTVLPDAVASLWRADLIARTDLSDLSCEAVGTLLHMTLGGPVAAATTAAVFQASRGNLLFVRELVHAAESIGDLKEEQGVWQLTSRLRSTPRLDQLVEDRLEAAPAAGMRVLELLSVVGGVSLELAHGHADWSVLEDLESAGLISVGSDGRRQQVSLAHPLYTEVIAAKLPELAKRRLLRRHADSVKGTGARRREDLVLLATWDLDAGGTSDPGLLVHAARFARFAHDLRGAERLSRAALREGATGDARAQALLLLGEALSEFGSFSEAETVLAQAAAALEDTASRVAAVRLRARNLTWGLLRPAAASQVLRELQEVEGLSPGARQELLAEQAMVLLVDGKPAGALSLYDDTAVSESDLRTRVVWAVPRAVSLISTGRCEEGLLAARSGRRDREVLGDAIAIAHPGEHGTIELYALQEAGEMVAAERLAREMYDASANDPSPFVRMWLTGSLGRNAMLSGRLRAAQRWLAEALSLSTEYGYELLRAGHLASLAVTSASLGNAAAARSAVEELEGVPSLGMVAWEGAQARAWSAVADGRFTQATDVLLAGAASAAADGRRLGQARLLHDVARLGGADRVVEGLTALARDAEGRLVPVLARHAEGAARGDADALLRVSEDFEVMGMWLHAAEAAAAAVTAFAGLPRAVAAARTRATSLAAQCEGARTPGLLTTDGVIPLTPREREVAILAAAGASSRELAGKLFLSPRTVDNHLQRIYTKLGVTSRGQLATALGTADN